MPYYMIINDNAAGFIKQNAAGKCKPVWLAFPACVYKIEVTTRGEGSDPIKEVVGRLRDYYRSASYMVSDQARTAKYSQMSVADRIAEDTGLRKAFVARLIRTIEEEEEAYDDLDLDGDEDEDAPEDDISDHPDSDGDEEDDEWDDDKSFQDYLARKSLLRGTEEHSKWYMVYDLLSQKFLPAFISEQDFDRLRKEVDEPRAYRPQLASSDEWYINCLSASYRRYPSQPTRQEMETAMRSNRRFSSKARDIMLRIDFDFVGGPEEWHIVTGCYFDQHDRYTFRATNPFAGGAAPWMRATVSDWCADEGIGKKVGELIDRIRPAQERSDDQDDAGQEKGAASLSDELMARLESDKVPVAGRLEKLISDYAWFSRVGRQQQERASARHEEFEFARQNYLVSLYTFLEELLYNCALKYRRSEDEAAYNEAIGKLSSSQNGTNRAELLRLAKAAGFETSEFGEMVGDFSKVNVEKLAADKKVLYDPAAFLYMNLVEAAAERRRADAAAADGKTAEMLHPFNRVDGGLLDLPNITFILCENRNRAKHGALDRLTESYRDCYHIVLDMFALVYGNYELPDPDSIDTAERSRSFKKAYDSARKKLEKYDGLWNFAGGERDGLNDIGKAAEMESISYHLDDPEYWAKLSNLYGVLLQEIIYACGIGGKKVDDRLIKRYLTGGVTKISDAVRKILETRSVIEPCGIDFGNFSAEGRLGRGADIEKLSTRNKLLYATMCIDTKAPRLFSNVAFRQAFAELCRSVDPVEKERGHNKQAASGDNNIKVKIKEDHEKALTLSNKIAGYLR